MPRNPNWTRDELILALDLYFRIDFVHHPIESNEIVELSNLLNELPIHPKDNADEKFRNPTGIYMKLCNFLRLDPTYTGKGLDAGSKLDVEVWNEFENDQDRLRQIASLIRKQYKFIPTRTTEQFDQDEDDEEFDEGKILTKLHKYRERDPKAARTKKRIVKKTTGALICEVCDFDFFQQYGKLGEDFAECHHKIPVSELKDGQTTKLEDLAIVCANCHRMLHRGKLKISIEDLRELVYVKRVN